MNNKQVPLTVDENGDLFLAGRKLKPKQAKRGYLNMEFAIHRLVAHAFLGPPGDDEAMVVDHIDGNPCNNRPENLRWVTQAENCRNQFKGKRWALTDEQIEEVKRLKPRSEIKSMSDLAARFGVSVGCIGAVRSGRNQTILKGGNPSPRQILTREAIREILAWKPPSPTSIEVARRFKVSSATIRNIWSEA